MIGTTAINAQLQSCWIGSNIDSYHCDSSIPYHPISDLSAIVSWIFRDIQSDSDLEVSVYFNLVLKMHLFEHASLGVSLHVITQLTNSLLSMKAPASVLMLRSGSSF